MRQRVDLTGGRKDGKQNRKIVCRTCLAGIRRGKIHCDARNRPVKRAGLDSSSYTFSGFCDRTGRQTDHIQTGQAVRRQAFDGDNITVDSAQTRGKNTRDHRTPSYVAQRLTLLIYYNFVDSAMQNDNCKGSVTFWNSMRLLFHNAKLLLIIGELLRICHIKCLHFW